MKVEVVNDFIDKHTKTRHNAGEVMEVTDDRFAEISAAGQFVTALDPEIPGDSDQGEEPAEVQHDVEQVEQEAPAAPKRKGKKNQ